MPPKSVINSQNCPGLPEILLGLDLNGAKKEQIPPGPVTIPGDGMEALAIFIPIRFQKGADVKDGTFEQFLAEHEQGDADATQSAVAVQKRMKSFKFRVQDALWDRL